MKVLAKFRAEEAVEEMWGRFYEHDTHTFNQRGSQPCAGSQSLSFLLIYAETNMKFALSPALLVVLSLRSRRTFDCTHTFKETYFVLL